MSSFLMTMLVVVVAAGAATDVARAVARQAARFDPATVQKAKAFAKRAPRARMEQEKELFCEMVTSPVVEAALRRFVESTDVRPYLP